MVLRRRGTGDVCTTDAEWEQIYGTTSSGNLPQHKKHHHVGHCWFPCPYSTQCDSLRRGLILPAYTGTINDHIAIDGKIHYMTTSSRGKWGYECTFFDEDDPTNPNKNCPYYITHGRRYFYT